MRYTEAVRVGRALVADATKSRLDLGLLITEIFPNPGPGGDQSNGADAPLAKYASKIGISIRSAREYRQVAEFYADHVEEIRDLQASYTVLRENMRATPRESMEYFRLLATAHPDGRVLTRSVRDDQGRASKDGRVVETMPAAKLTEAIANRPDAREIIGEADRKADAEERRVRDAEIEENLPSDVRAQISGAEHYERPGVHEREFLDLVARAMTAAMAVADYAASTPLAAEKVGEILLRRRRDDPRKHRPHRVHPERFRDAPRELAASQKKGNHHE